MKNRLQTVIQETLPRNQVKNNTSKDQPISLIERKSRLGLRHTMTLIRFTVRLGRMMHLHHSSDGDVSIGSMETHNEHVKKTELFDVIWLYRTLGTETIKRRAKKTSANLVITATHILDSYRTTTPSS